MGKQSIFITVDAVILQEEVNDKSVLLVKRKNDPFKDQWALPGGFLEEDETFEAGAIRELEEETGLKIDTLEQAGVVGTPGRDPRGRTISIIFFGIVNNPGKVKGNDDASDAGWFNLNNLPRLAFDHLQILKDIFKIKNY